MELNCYLLRLLGLSMVLLAPTVNSHSTKWCHPDCVCTPHYLSTLNSWNWLDTELILDHPNLNAGSQMNYTQHNEVIEDTHSGGTLNKMNGGEEGTLDYVTCILRQQSDNYVTNILHRIHPKTKILSLLQAPGSGKIVLGRRHFKRLERLIALEIEGKEEDGLEIEGDAFGLMPNLIYLSLEGISLLKKDIVEGQVALDLIKKELVEEGEIGGGSEIEPEIVPYSIYKETAVDYNNNADNFRNFGKIKKGIPAKPEVAVAFTDLPSLEQLKLRKCEMPAEVGISWDMFHGLGGLRSLLLEDNDLLFLPEFVFYSTPNLTILSLSSNRILSLGAIGLAGLLQLERLDISKNNVTHLSELSLPPFPNLELADLRDNPIESIFPNTFEVMNNTKVLFLGGPKVQIVFFTNTFHGLDSLIRLEINNANIPFLERQMLSGMPNLRTLIINGNISRISYDAFSQVPKLTTLRLRDAAIHKISMDAFIGLRDLLELDLASNKITLLPPGIFDELGSLREIYLQNNMLMSLPSNIFSKIPAQIIRLEENSWHCSCDINSWNPSKVNRVKRWTFVSNDTFCGLPGEKGSVCQPNFVPVRRPKFVYEKRVTPLCASPSHLIGQSVFEVIRKDLAHCSLKNKTITTKFIKKARMLQDILGKGNANVNTSLSVKNNTTITEDQEGETNKIGGGGGFMSRHKEKYGKKYFIGGRFGKMAKGKPSESTSTISTTTATKTITTIPLLSSTITTTQNLTVEESTVSTVTMSNELNVMPEVKKINQNNNIQIKKSEELSMKDDEDADDIMSNDISAMPLENFGGVGGGDERGGRKGRKRRRRGERYGGEQKMGKNQLLEKLKSLFQFRK